MLSIKGQNITKVLKRPQSINKNPGQSQTSISKPPLPKKKSRNVKVLRHEYVCDQRKENNLQSRFLKKKEKLFQITKQNVRIFQKINTQKSVYSHRSLNKSYESNKSLVNSRASKKSLNKSQISQRSNQSNKSNTSIKNKFWNRSLSAQNITTANPPQNIKNNKIVVRDIKRKSMINLKSKNIQDTKKQQIQQFTQLFNIKQQPTLKQRNRINRIKSTKIVRTNTCPKFSRNTPSSGSNIANKSKQILINQENQIQIHEEIQAEQESTYRYKKSDIRTNSKVSINNQNSSRNVIQERIGSSRNKNQNKQELIKGMLTLQNQQKQRLNTHNKTQQNDSKPNNVLTITNIMTQNILSASSSKKQLSQSSRRRQNTQQKIQNIQNLFQLKNSNLRSRMSQRAAKQNHLNINIKSSKINFKYSNLLMKINQELEKAKKPKESSIYQYRSRLVG